MFSSKIRKATREKAKQEMARREKIEFIARIAHEVNRAYCKTIGDDSQVAWEEAPDWQKNSVKNGVEYHLNNPDSKASHSHENWMDVKIKEGWKWGHRKDPEKKEHPCMQAFEMLPKEQQTKDHLFLAVVRALEV